MNSYKQTNMSTTEIGGSQLTAAVVMCTGEQVSSTGPGPAVLDLLKVKRMGATLQQLASLIRNEIS